MAALQLQSPLARPRFPTEATPRLRENYVIPARGWQEYSELGAKLTDCC